eukprot:362215-Chlamydomonas_euryale.AAC.2
MGEKLRVAAARCLKSCPHFGPSRRQPALGVSWTRGELDTGPAPRRLPRQRPLQAAPPEAPAGCPPKGPCRLPRQRPLQAAPQKAPAGCPSKGPCRLPLKRPQQAVPPEAPAGCPAKASAIVRATVQETHTANNSMTTRDLVISFLPCPRTRFGWLPCQRAACHRVWHGA